jgi:hypothetical protein
MLKFLHSHHLIDFLQAVFLWELLVIQYFYALAYGWLPACFACCLLVAFQFWPQLSRQ